MSHGLKGSLKRHVPQARQSLRKVMVGQLQCLPMKEEGTVGDKATGQKSYEKLLPRDLVPTSVASPTGPADGWKELNSFTIHAFCAAA